MMKKNYLTFCILFSLIHMLLSCNQKENTGITVSGLDSADFSKVWNGKSIGIFTLKNNSGLEVCITNYGGRIVSLMVPDRDGQLKDIVLGFDHIDDYLEKPSSFGATVGRFANRIANGRFVLDNDTIQLDINSGEHSIHGGSMGWQNQVFDVEHTSDSLLILSYTSVDGEGGYPGEVKANVKFCLTENNALEISYEATTDRRTAVNMTNHSFFNLSGDPNESVLSHVLYVNADSITPLDERLITTGEIIAVDATPFDFREPVDVETAIARSPEHIQLGYVKGIDHNYVLNTAGNAQVLAASAYSAKTGILLDVYTDEPGLQVYTGNMLDGSRTGKNKVTYGKNAGFCLESQHYPDSPNKSTWPSTILEPGDVYKSVCIYRFGIKK